MDLIAWLVVGGLVGATLVVIALAPRLKRSNLRRQLTGGGSLGGLAGGIDAVWRPTAEDANAGWERETVLPAPAPLAGGKDDLDGDGPLVIRVKD
ncbi:hypothetical protein [Microbacterium sp. Root61]|uniref:hypothetical protein n=1 Tax=Microbacterium sp. Root61 TaxID=1736570 RepID=UPI0009E98329|nr:hypothetical protein [Microbacterium sp. Root61]